MLQGVKQWILKIIPADSRLRKWLLRFYYYWKPRSGDLGNALQQFANQHETLKFLQIGSNNGLSGDPIHQHVVERDWSGILVEPVPYLFEQLVKNYADQDGLYFEQSAVANTSGEAVFYHLKPTDDPSLPDWYEQLGSFDREVILNHQKIIPQIEDLITTIEVPTVTISQLLHRYNFEGLNLIHIDTEGYDAILVQQIPFDALKHLQLVLFEHCHLHVKDYRDCLRLLKQKGFRFIADDSDTLALRNV